MNIKFLLIAIFSSSVLFSQEMLENLDDFRPQAGNWKIVGDVIMNKDVDIHSLTKSLSKSKSKKRKRRKNKKGQLKPVIFANGTGILLNINEKHKNDPLITKLEHGDLKLELDFMLPKGSNSGIYLQGRYELQLFDSWGVKNPKFSDVGGIYRNWETKPEKIFRGIPPSSNASKAPGLWQHLKIHFQAPRFDKQGEKVSNAKFISVELNGVNIHSNVEIPFPTGGPISKKEVPKGPLMIQGDHGSVAFKNINFSPIEELKAELLSLKYKTYKGVFEGLKEIKEHSVFSEGTAKQININDLDEDDNYAIVYEGILNFPKEDHYKISVKYSGGIRLQIDNKKLIENDHVEDKGNLEETIRLSAGQHSFSLTNVKSAEWRAPRLGMYIESSSSNSKPFHAFESDVPNTNLVSPIFVNTESTPSLLRAFVSFEGKGKRLSHTIGVGTPEGINFVYDLGAANIIGVWRGDFLDATPMWHERGDGSFKPRGAVQWTFLNQQIAELESLDIAFPETGTSPDFVQKGYYIDENTELPIFEHIYKGVKISNKIVPDNSKKYIAHNVSFSRKEMTNWYFKIASGKAKKMQNGSYSVNNQQYYVKLLTDQVPITREIDGKTELLMPVDGKDINYEIIW